ncbi:hypothetical protein SAMN05518672_111105 [Chitinophaga sp. CF118]|uniref:hypothetical protein n=1 Tax=Chitinophaga sp. CF118 TaxID=1884367 RepID=UPI0008E71B80|nr:hypothetical protein [Chitinophaga sp. CF118]SFE86901.1 hypothetical protein SAMN05518672_111105 [Chitinophaga sp. CF118]
MRKYYLLSGLFVVITSLPIYAQSGKAKKAASTTAKTTTLRFRSTWGIFLSETLPRPEILNLLDSSLVVRDEKNNKYPVVSFDFTYEKKETYLNDTTGKPGVYTEFVGDKFEGDKLPSFWSSRIKETLSKGEVLYFDNIIIKYTGDKLYRVPKLQFKVN